MNVICVDPPPISSTPTAFDRDLETRKENSYWDKLIEKVRNRMHSFHRIVIGPLKCLTKIVVMDAVIMTEKHFLKLLNPCAASSPSSYYLSQFLRGLMVKRLRPIRKLTSP